MRKFGAALGPATRDIFIHSSQSLGVNLCKGLSESAVRDGDISFTRRSRPAFRIV